MHIHTIAKALMLWPLVGTWSTASATHHIDLPAASADMTFSLQLAIDSAATFNGMPVEIVLQPADYHISKENATRRLYHVSNTTSQTVNPDPTKHIGLLMRHLRNLTINGNGARLVTHGEMTPWVVDSCENITLKNLTITAADPTVPEMTVIGIDSIGFTAKVHPWSDYTIENDRLHWKGDGWDFTDGIAQIYRHKDGVTHRVPSPVAEAEAVEETSPGTLRFEIASTPGIIPGDVYQMRHSFRTEVCGFINRSKDITLKNLNINFTGNFGIVAQYSENITYDSVNCKPDPESGRTCAGFADFLQVSGCRGHILITGCEFAGSHDDPVNIHGTHLKIIERTTPSSIKARFMHPETYGFEAFSAGDSVEIINSGTLLPVFGCKVVSATLTNDYEMQIELDKPLPARQAGITDFVIENTTWTPDVTITDCLFTLTPVRGILVSTRGKVLIADNIFRRIPLSAILIADDARSWYESGYVRDVTIRGNKFIQCSSPAILIWPECGESSQPVHSGIAIHDNDIDITGECAIKARNVNRLSIKDNQITSGNSVTENIFQLDNCHGTIVADKSLFRQNLTREYVLSYQGICVNLWGMDGATPLRAIRILLSDIKI